MQDIAVLLQKLNNIQRNALKTIPRKVGAALVRHYNKRFREESWEGQSWKDRSKNPRTPPSGAGKKGKGRNILVQTGDLKRSIESSTSGMTLTISTDKDYAQVHNEGLQVNGTARIKAHTRKSSKGKQYTVKSHSRKVNFKMPKRQFMDAPAQTLAPQSANIVIDTLEKEIDKHFGQV